MRESNNVFALEKKLDGNNVSAARLSCARQAAGGRRAPREGGCLRTELLHRKKARTDLDAVHSPEVAPPEEVSVTRPLLGGAIPPRHIWAAHPRLPRVQEAQGDPLQGRGGG